MPVLYFKGSVAQWTETKSGECFSTLIVHQSIIRYTLIAHGIKICDTNESLIREI